MILHSLNVGLIFILKSNCFIILHEFFNDKWRNLSKFELNFIIKVFTYFVLGYGDFKLEFENFNFYVLKNFLIKML